MSEIKKPGVRDISELKSKLGLKKPTAPGAPGQPAQPAAPAAIEAPPSGATASVSERDTGPTAAVPAASAPTPSASASPFGEPARAPTVPPAAPVPVPSASPFASPFGAPAGVPTARPSSLPPGLGAARFDPMAPPPGGASIVPVAQTRAAPAEAPKVIPGTNILTTEGLFGGRRAYIDSDHTDQRLEQIKARQKPGVSKLALVLALVSGAGAMAGGVVWGMTAFPRSFERTRAIEIQALKTTVAKTVNKILEVDAGLSKTTDVKSRVEFSKWLGTNFSEDDLIKSDKMAGRNIAFMKGSTSALLMKYVRFSREFFLDSIRFAKKNVFAEDSLLSLEKGGGPPKTYGALVTSEEGAAFATSTLVIILERKTLTLKDISVPEADGEFPNDTFKDGDTACKLMADPEAPWEWFPCSQILPVPDTELIPKEDMALLEDHNQQLAHLKLDLKDLKDLGAKLSAALDEELARSPDL